MQAWKTIILAGALLLAGCATPIGGIPDAPDMGNVWPVPPDQPRVAYLHEVRVPADIGVSEGFWGRVVGSIAGRKKPPSIEEPVGIYADAEGWMMVADPGLQVVHLFNLKKKTYRQAFRLPEGRLASPVGVAYDPERDWVFVSDSIHNRIFVYHTNGDYVGLFGEGLSRVSGLAWDRAGRQLVAVDTGNHRVLVYGPEGRLVREIGGRGDQPGQFNFPTHVALDGEGRILVTDSLNFRVQVLTLEGEPVRQIGSLGQVVGTFSKPKGVAVDGQGQTYVVDGIYDVVQMFDREGQLLMHFGSAGSEPGHFWLPAGVAVADGQVFVADTHNRRIQMFRLLAAPEGGS
ncbi:MAG: 6-bladed beta-propeller [Leptospirillia bacterium]